jgi:hypothetical protein
MLLRLYAHRLLPGTFPFPIMRMMMKIRVFVVPVVCRVDKIFAGFLPAHG